ncbi:MAG: hypothetical protein GC192_21005 [Bacteroidetes bacterium]|nr:hypothetical protein [Bacteroidota bacterium]
MKLLTLMFPLLMMAQEDFRYRTIHWAWLALFIVGIIWCIPIDWRICLYNSILVSTQLLALTLFFSVKTARLVFLPSEYLGWGDILFFIPLCLLFSPGNLIIFTVLSLCTGIGWFLVYRMFFGKMVETVPLAGFFSICLIVVLIIHVFIDYDFRDDSILIRLAQHISGNS